MGAPALAGRTGTGWERGKRGVCLVLPWRKKKKRPPGRCDAMALWALSLHFLRAAAIASTDPVPCRRTIVVPRWNNETRLEGILAWPCSRRTGFLENAVGSIQDTTSTETKKIEWLVTRTALACLSPSWLLPRPVLTIWPPCFALLSRSALSILALCQPFHSCHAMPCHATGHQKNAGLVPVQLWLTEPR